MSSAFLAIAAVGGAYVWHRKKKLDGAVQKRTLNTEPETEVSTKPVRDVQYEDEVPPPGLAEAHRGVAKMKKKPDMAPLAPENLLRFEQEYRLRTGKPMDSAEALRFAEIKGKGHEPGPRPKVPQRFTGRARMLNPGFGGLRKHFEYIRRTREPTRIDFSSRKQYDEGYYAPKILK